VKLKTCKQCKSRFVPARPLQVVCGPMCGIERAKKARLTTEKKQDRAKRESLKTIPQLIKEAQVEFNKFIRTRDEREPCISCGKPPGDLSGLHAGRDAGHYRSTGAAAHLRFDERNCHAQCVKCNQHLSGNAVQYRIGLLARIGLDAVEALEADNEPVKWDRDTLRQIKVIYRAKTRALKKEQA
jgi:hypothetical protein